MKIGITERGDPSLDFSWKEKIDDMDGVIFVTKNLTDKLIEETTPYWDKIIFHITCTGYGGTVVEPNIPTFDKQLSQALKLVKMGFSKERAVIRIDPIIPTDRGLKTACKVLLNAYNLGFRRFRISLLDCYPHVRERMKLVRIEPPYGDNGFSPTNNMFENTDSVVRQLKAIKSDIIIESCAEGKLKETEKVGCISHKDLALLGLSVENVDSVGYQRKGCLCCSAKTELLSEKKRCPYKCLYCYWKD